MDFIRNNSELIYGRSNELKYWAVIRNQEHCVSRHWEAGTPILWEIMGFN